MPAGGADPDPDPEPFLDKFTGYGYNDMCHMTDLTPETILSNLETRFKGEIVYTAVGGVVLSVNPFKNTRCVGSQIRSRYRDKAQHSGLPPHLYTLVVLAYEAATSAEQTSQSILISGESGAGKTEAMKICLTLIGELNEPGERAATALGSAEESVSAQLMNTNPVMEAIGNAKTIRNNNSSRFGKHFDIQLDANGRILGAHTSCYLLEKPRICVHLEQERNYHVFYMLCKADPSIRQPVQIGEWPMYQICNQKGTVERVETWDDEEEFCAMHAALLKLGFKESERESLYRMISLVLNLGNLALDAGTPTRVRDRDLLDDCAVMLQVSAAQLEHALTTITTPMFTKGLEKPQAEAARNSLCMHVYSLGFGWCVRVINQGISRPAKASVCLGVLDIFGFENFGTNSFPQLCINLTNESLHNLFISYMFKLEQKVYEEQDINWTFVEYVDNQPTLDLIQKPPISVFHLLDDGCKASQQDASILQNMDDALPNIQVAGSSMYQKSRRSGLFIIKHYAACVTYTMSGFVEKNKDELSQDLSDLLTVHSQFAELKRCAQEHQKEMEDIESSKGTKVTKGGKQAAKRKKTVSKAFSEALSTLMGKLRQTGHFYVRCLKPNQKLMAGVWDPTFMKSQVAYSGTLELTRIRKAGLNTRKKLQWFFGFFKVCARDFSAFKRGKKEKHLDVRRCTTALLAQLDHELGQNWLQLDQRPTAGQPLVNAKLARFLGTFLAGESDDTELTREELVALGLQDLTRDSWIEVTAPSGGRRCWFKPTELNPAEYRVGRSIVFFKDDRPIEYLERRRERKLPWHRENLHNLLRAVVCRKRYLTARKRIIKMQQTRRASIEGQLVFWAYADVKGASEVLLRYARGYLLMRHGLLPSKQDATAAPRDGISARGLPSAREQSWSARDKGWKGMISARTKSSSRNTLLTARSDLTTVRLLVRFVFPRDQVHILRDERREAERIKQELPGSQMTKADEPATLLAPRRFVRFEYAVREVRVGGRILHDARHIRIGNGFVSVYDHIDLGAQHLASYSLIDYFVDHAQSRLTQSESGEQALQLTLVPLRAVRDDSLLQPLAETSKANAKLKVAALPIKRASPASDNAIAQLKAAITPPSEPITFMITVTVNPAAGVANDTSEDVTPWVRPFEEAIAESHEHEQLLSMSPAAGPQQPTEIKAERLHVMFESLIGPTNSPEWHQFYCMAFGNGVLRLYATSRGRSARKPKDDALVAQLNLALYAIRIVRRQEPASRATAHTGRPQMTRANSLLSFVTARKLWPQVSQLGFSKEPPASSVLELTNGSSRWLLATHADALDGWFRLLHLSATYAYQRCPIFHQHVVMVRALDGAIAEIPITDKTTCEEVRWKACKLLGIPEDRQSCWQLHEELRFGENGLAHSRRLPGAEVIVDQTLLLWERTERGRHGMVAHASASDYRFILRCAVLPDFDADEPREDARELQMIYAQALLDFKRGRVVSVDQNANIDSTELVGDLCAFVLFWQVTKHQAAAALPLLSPRSSSEIASTPRQLRRSREGTLLKPGNLQADETFRALAYKWQIAQAESTPRGEEARLNPAAVDKFAVPDAEWLTDCATELLPQGCNVSKEWHDRIVASFDALVAGNVSDEQRKQRCGGLLAIDALTRSKAMQVVIERVSFAPLAFNCVFDAELWSTTTDAKMEVKVSINRCGMYLYTSDGILCHFFALEDKLVAWMPLNCMIILYVVHEECLSLFSEEDVNKTKVKVDGDGTLEVNDTVREVRWPELPGEPCQGMIQSVDTKVVVQCSDNSTAHLPNPFVPALRKLHLLMSEPGEASLAAQLLDHHLKATQEQGANAEDGEPSSRPSPLGWLPFCAVSNLGTNADGTAEISGATAMEIHASVAIALNPTSPMVQRGPRDGNGDARERSSEASSLSTPQRGRVAARTASSHKLARKTSASHPQENISQVL